ncbi:MAG: ABC transporter permease [Acidimicrobiales bacterium]
MSSMAMLFTQLRYTNKAYWRNPAAAFFTFAFPLMFLLVFTALLGNGHIVVAGKLVHQSTYYVAAMAGFAVISASYTNIAMTITTQRDLGILKRVEGSPLPGWVYLTARVVHAVIVAVLLVLITAVFGAAFYHAAVPSGMTLVRFAIMVLVGSGAFSALGFAITAAVPNADAAPAIVNASILPVLFLSGIFIPLTAHSPAWIEFVAKVFPVKYFASGLEAGFLGTAFSWRDVAVVAAWGIGGLLVAIRTFTWEPRT